MGDEPSGQEILGLRKVTLSGRTAVTPDAGAPAPLDPATGMYKDYWVLSAAERAKGFIRPIRHTYKHVGLAQPKGLRDLTPEELKRYAQYGYVKYEAYVPGHPEYKEGSAVTGRFWTKDQLGNSGCGTTTKMGPAIAETYARDPKFYGSTYCCHCQSHFPVGPHGEFVWMNNDGTATNERVGS